MGYFESNCVSIFIVYKTEVMHKLNVPMSFFVTPEMKQAIDEAAWREKTDVSKLLRRLCEEYLSKSEEVK